MPPAVENGLLAVAMRIARGDNNESLRDKKLGSEYAQKRLALELLVKKQARIGEYDGTNQTNETVFNIVSGLITLELAKAGLNIGEIYQQGFHLHRVTGLVVPLQTKEGDGLVDIVYDPAINDLTWKLPVGHPLLMQYPSLGSIWEDKETGKGIRGDESFLEPKKLAERTLTRVSLNSAAQALHEALSFLHYGEDLDCLRAYPAKYHTDERADVKSELEVFHRDEGLVLSLEMTNRTGKRLVDSARLGIIGRLNDKIKGEYLKTEKVNKYVAQAVDL